MKQSFTLGLITLLICSSVLISFALPNNEIIGIVNDENILLSDFQRLLNAQKKHNNNLDETSLKEKLIEQIVNKMIALQEAKKRNLTISEEEISRKINYIKEKQGGDEAFKKFLAKNNANIDDAKEEIKKQILYKLLKKQFSNNDQFHDLIVDLKTNASIVIYNDKIFNDIASIRNTPYPAITKNKLEEVKKIEEDTNKTLEEMLVQEQKEVKDKPNKLSLRPKKEIHINHLTKPTILRPIAISKKPTYQEPIIIQEQKLDKIKNYFKKKISNVKKQNLKAHKAKSLDLSKVKAHYRNMKAKLTKISKPKIKIAQTNNAELVPGTPVISDKLPVVSGKEKTDISPPKAGQPMAEKQKPTTQLRPKIAEQPSKPQASSHKLQANNNLQNLNVFQRTNRNIENIQFTEDRQRTLEELRKKIEQRRITLRNKYAK